MSGTLTRHLYNNICSFENDVRYLEIGTWKGSSLISSLYGNNHVKAVVIDNWSQFGGPRDEFDKNIQKFIPNANLEVIENESFSIDLKSTFGDRKFNIYLYDGDHSAEAQSKALTYYKPL